MLKQLNYTEESRGNKVLKTRGKLSPKICVMCSLLLFSSSCSNSGLTIGEEVNYLGSFATYLYLGFTNPDSLPDGMDPFDYNEPPDDGY